MNIKEARDRYGWSRKQLADMLDWPMSRVWSIETGKREPTEDEVATLRDVFSRDGTVLEFDDDPEVAAEAEHLRQGELAMRRIEIERYTPDGATRVIEWNGFTYGDTIKIRGCEGQFRFMFHHVDDHQEYVQVIGGKAKRRGLRCFTVDRVVPRKMRVTP